MACNCKNEDGTLKDVCGGTCDKGKNNFTINVNEQKRSQEDSFTSNQLEQIKCIVIGAVGRAIQELNIHNIYRGAFQDGFSLGFDKGKEDQNY